MTNGRIHVSRKLTSGDMFNNLAGEFCTGFIKSFCTVRIIHQTGLVNLGFILIRENNLIAFNFNFANLFLLSHADESAVIDLFHAVLLNQRHNECIEKMRMSRTIV